MLRMNEDFRLPFFDPDYCLKVARWSSVVCVGWLLIELILLGVLEPDPRRCSKWIIHRNEPAEMHVGLLILMFTAAPAAWMCYVALRWRHFAEKMLNGILARPDLIMDHNRLFLTVCTGWALFCAIPLGLMLRTCTSVFEYLGF
jgi:hypothetical protein